MLARNAYNTEFGDAGRLLARHRAAAVVHLRPRRVHRPQPHAERAGGARSASRLAGRIGAGLDPCARAAGRRCEIEPGERGAWRSCSARGATRRTRPSWPRATRSLAQCEAALGATPSAAGTTRSARSRCSTPDDSFDLIVNRWLLYQTLELPHLGAQRPVSAGRRVRVPRSAAGRAGAASTRGRTSVASTCCAPRRGSSSRATCSTGGIRRAGAARGRAAPTICCGCRTPSPRYVVADRRRRRCSTRSCRSSKAPPLEPRAAEIYTLPRVSRRDGVALRARACAPSIAR